MFHGETQRDAEIAEENRISKVVLDSAIRVHRRLGPGLFESVYEVVLAAELARRGLRVERQVGVPLVYEGIRFDIAFRADLIVNDLVIVELKSVESVGPVHRRQLLTYLRLANKKLGLLLNFNVELLKDGYCRVVNGL
jgi:GxxExxY protein